MVFNRLKSDFVLVRFRDNTYGIVYQKRYSNTLSRKLEKRARVLFRGNTRSCKFWTDVPVQKSQVCHLCLQYVSKKSDNSEGQIQNTYSIIQFLKKESLQLVIVS